MGEGFLIDDRALLVFEVDMSIGKDESFEDLNAFRLFAEDGVERPSPNMLLFRSMLDLPLLEGFSWRCFFTHSARIASALVDVNNKGASVLTSKELGANAGCSEGSGTGSSHSVVKSPLTLAIESFSGEVTFKAVMRSISQSLRESCRNMADLETNCCGVIASLLRTRL